MTMTLFLRFFEVLGLKERLRVNINIKINKFKKHTRESSSRSTARLPNCKTYI